MRPAGPGKAGIGQDTRRDICPEYLEQASVDGLLSPPISAASPLAITGKWWRRSCGLQGKPEATDEPLLFLHCLDEHRYELRMVYAEILSRFSRKPGGVAPRPHLYSQQPGLSWLNLLGGSLPNATLGIARLAHG